jgi:hypothetical protein
VKLKNEDLTEELSIVKLKNKGLTQELSMFKNECERLKR